MSPEDYGLSEVELKKKWPKGHPVYTHQDFLIHKVDCSYYYWLFLQLRYEAFYCGDLL
jgi:hypothetical protein